MDIILIETIFDTLNAKAALYAVQKIAEERGGKCLSVNYINARMKLGWECIKGHRWFATPDNVKRGTWCPKCAIENLKKPK